MTVGYQELCDNRTKKTSGPAAAAAAGLVYHFYWSDADEELCVCVWIDW